MSSSWLALLLLFFIRKWECICPIQCIDVIIRILTVGYRNIIVPWKCLKFALASSSMYALSLSTWCWQMGPHRFFPVADNQTPGLNWGSSGNHLHMRMTLNQLLSGFLMVLKCSNYVHCALVLSINWLVASPDKTIFYQFISIFIQYPLIANIHWVILNDGSQLWRCSHIHFNAPTQNCQRINSFYPSNSTECFRSACCADRALSIP